MLQKFTEGWVVCFFFFFTIFSVISGNPLFCLGCGFQQWLRDFNSTSSHAPEFRGFGKFLF